MTTIYFIRHSKTLKVNNKLNNDSFQIQNEKQSLSIEGEKIAQEKMNKEELNQVDIIISSNYVRAIQTAKYLAEKNNLEIIIDSNIGERIFGVSKIDELPENFERKQFSDENYKLASGESQKEVRERMTNTLTRILNEYRNKKIAIISHGTAISYLLKNWCDIDIVNDKLRYTYKGKIILDGYFDYCETFKLEFDDNNNLINISNIK